jgi:hypothetical protein
MSLLITPAWRAGVESGAQSRDNSTNLGNPGAASPPSVSFGAPTYPMGSTKDQACDSTIGDNVS